MPERHILIVAVDGLRASALGAYGNTAFPTPALDHLAANSFLFDSCFAPAAGLPSVYRALWQSLHPLRTDDYAAGATSLPQLLADRGYKTALITDEAVLASLAGGADLATRLLVSDEVGSRARDVTQTALARLFADACELIASLRNGPQLLWIHSRGMYGPWDAPLELLQMQLDEQDPPPVESIASPDFEILDGDEPDIAFRYGAAYAAQVMVLDDCWNGLRNAIASDGPRGNWLVMLLGVRGMPLGEHRRVGGVDRRLYVEQLHVPWLVQFPDGAGRLARTGRLVSSLDLLPTLVDWVDEDVHSDASQLDGRSTLNLVRPKCSPWRDALVFGSNEITGRAIRSSSWSLRYDAARNADDRSDARELFVRPDDRWEANDVAALCPDVVDDLTTAGATMAARIQTGERMPDETFAET